METLFEWNPRKATSNLAKHGIDFPEAITVFSDPLASIFDDDDHSEDEKREIIVGHSSRGRLLFVCFTEQRNVIRIFSARSATKQEKEDYEDATKS